jgi:cobaltochelatase CobT
MKSKNSQINQIKEDLIATLRAIVCDEVVQVEFDENQRNNFFSWNQNLVFDEKKVLIPAIQTDEIFSEENLVRRFRASLDMAACYLLFHDKKIEQEQNFSKEEQKIFDEFEKARVISSVKSSYLGVVKNILAKVEDDIFSAEAPLSLLLLKETFSQEILPKTKDVILDLEKKLSKKILGEIKNLTKNISNQSAFGQGVERIIELLRQEQETQEKEENNSAADSNQEKNQKPQDDLTSFGQENIDAKNEESFLQNQEEESSQQIEDQTKITDLKDDDKKGEVSLKLDKSSSEESGVEFKNAYKTFTSKFDEIIFPQKLIAKNELGYLRDQLDLKLAKLGSISKKMSLKLKRKLLSKRNSFLEYDSSRGVLDRKKLTRMVIDPLMEDVWINNKTHEYQDTALTILLDNSGSMRGNPIVMSAMACEIIAGILEKFSIKTEIIGFTTADWKGGRARKLWESSGRPKNPGRLNELRHIIYKHFNQSFKKSKVNLGLMLKEGILKENIDGEALLFARSRLMQQSEKRKILLVISDGTPVDDSTALANDSDILSDHLNYVIKKIEKSSKIEIVGIGIGHTTEEFYRNSITIKNLEELGDVMIKKITELL